MSVSRSHRKSTQSRSSWLRGLAMALLIAFGVVTLIVVLPTGWVGLRYQSRIYADPSAVPAAPVAIVFGAAIYPNGEPSLMLADRIDAAVSLYDLGKVQRILMTGDNGQADYDEVSAMKRYAVSKGVPAERVNLDHAGFRTYDSCYRAKEVFGITSAVLVTQRYHLPRALYLANSFGIDAVGLKAGRDYYVRQEYYNLREAAALFATFWEVHVLQPGPRFLGDPVDLEDQNRP